MVSRLSHRTISVRTELVEVQAKGFDRLSLNGFLYDLAFNRIRTSAARTTVRPEVSKGSARASIPQPERVSMRSKANRYDPSAPFCDRWPANACREFGHTQQTKIVLQQFLHVAHSRRDCVRRTTQAHVSEAASSECGRYS